MTVLDSLAKQASRMATDVQLSLRRARIEGERRLLQRQHRTALEDLGERVYELVRAGKMPEGELGPEVAAVENKLIEIEAKVSEIEALDREDANGGGRDAEGADAAFPMVDRPAGEAPRRTGWEGADKFFKKPQD